MRGDDPGFGWVIVTTLGVTETVSYGVLYYAFSVLLVPMQNATGWSAATLTGAYSLALLVSGLAAPLVGRLLDQHSPRLLMTAGSTLAALLLLAWSRVSSLPELYLVFGGLGVAMALVLYEPAFVVVTKWFRHRRHAALTTLTLIAAWASFVFSPLTQHFVGAYGWRQTVVILALILAVVTVPLHAIVLRSPPRLDETKAAQRSTSTSAHGRGFWLIVAAFSLSSFVTVAIAVHVVRLLLGAGMSGTFAAFAAGLLGLSQILGRVLFAVIGRRLSSAATAGVVFALASAMLLFLALVHGRSAALIFVVCFGMSNGMATLLRATVVGDLYGRANYGAIAGRVSFFALAARAAAPFGAAVIALAPGGYTTMLIVLALVAAVAAAAAVIGTASEQALALSRSLVRSESATLAAHLLLERRDGTQMPEPADTGLPAW